MHAPAPHFPVLEDSFLHTILTLLQFGLLLLGSHFPL